MRAKDVKLLDAVIDRISSSITAADMPGVSISQVNLVMPDGLPVVLLWEADPPADDGTAATTGDWRIQAQ
jgi:hypothetical protein